MCDRRRGFHNQRFQKFSRAKLVRREWLKCEENIRMHRLQGVLLGLWHLTSQRVPAMMCMSWTRLGCLEVSDHFFPKRILSECK